jgi:hypothetical protein
MSGLDKSISAYLTHGSVEKMPCTKACSFFKDFDDFTHGSTTTVVKDNAKHVIETSVEKKDEGTCAFNWSV